MQNKKQTRGIDVSSMVYGKVPPQAEELEQAILGGIMLERNALDIAALILTPEAFYLDVHQRVFRAILALNARNAAIDILTVVNELKTAGDLDVVGGPYAVTKLTNSVVTGAHIETHCRIVKQKFIAREMIRIAGEILNDAYEDSTDAFDQLDLAEQKILAIGENSMPGEMIPIESVVVQGLAQIEKHRKMDSHVTGVSTGFPTLDRATRGWQPGLIILGARPSVGKTALALEIAKAAAANNIKNVAVGMWSLEMKAVQQVIRMLAAESEMYLTRLHTGRIDDLDMKIVYEAAQRLSRLKIFFDDGFGLTILSLSAKARRLKRKMEKTQTPLGLIIIDYLQLVSGNGDKKNREQEIASISRGLKKLSMELNIPIIALSQLSRALESRTAGNREPQLSDLRESGSLEQDADMVMFIWAPDEKDIIEDGSLINRRYIKIAKQRDGMLLKVDLEFRADIQRIIEFTEQRSMPLKEGGNWKQLPTEREDESPF